MDSATASSKSQARPSGLGVRHFQAALTFLCLALAYAMRAGLSVGIVAMTTSTGYNHDLPILDWSSAQQGIILSSFFWGYLILQIPAGNISRRVGPKYILFAAMLASALVTMASPLIALNFNWIVFCGSRVLEGLLQGFITPTCNTHISKWAPPQERSRMFSFVFGGSQFGAMVMLFVAGYLAASPWGWPSIFYVTGLCGILWAVVWLFVGANSPDSHSSISPAERAYIKISLTANSDDSSKMVTPWKEICCSVPMWALLLTHLSENWGYWMLLTMLPSYMSHVLHFNIQDNGLMSSLPYIALCILTWTFSWIGDYLIAKQYLSIKVSRKFWNSVSHWGGAAALVSISFISSASVAVALLTAAVGLNAGVYNGFLCNHLDLAPNFAGLLMGITNGLSNITAILGPMVTGFIVQDLSNKDEWMTAFYIAAAVFFVGNLIFMVLGSTEVQPWNSPPLENKKRHNKETA